MDQITNKPDTQGSINIWAMLAAVVVAAVIAGGVTYYFQKTTSETEKQQSNQNIQTLQQQISQLQTQISQLEQKDVEKQEPVVKQQEKEETANWKSFTSAEFGYSFKYPSTYIVKDYGEYVEIYKSTDKEHLYAVDSLVNFYGQKTNMTLSSIIKDNVANKVLSEAKTITLNGLSAYEGVKQGMINLYAIIVKNNSNLVEITFNTNKDNLQQNRATLTNIQKLILSTFKFTK